MLRKLYNKFLELPEPIFNVILWALAGFIMSALICACFVHENYDSHLQPTAPQIRFSSFVFIVVQPEKTEPNTTIEEEEVPNVKESQMGMGVRTKELYAPGSSSFKSYMDAVAIRNKRSAQYKFKSKYTLDPDTGIYMVDDRYCVALGSYYTTEIGTKVDVVLDSGNIIPCILADCKSDAHTDKTHRQNPNGSVVEFIVRTKSLSRTVRRMGDCSYAKEEWGGNVASIIVYEE